MQDRGSEGCFHIERVVRIIPSYVPASGHRGLKKIRYMFHVIFFIKHFT